MWREAAFGVALVPACVQVLHRQGVVYRPLAGEDSPVEQRRPRLVRVGEPAEEHEVGRAGQRRVAECGQGEDHAVAALQARFERAEDGDARMFGRIGRGERLLEGEGLRRRAVRAQQLQALLPRVVPSTETALLAVTQLHGSDAPNVIPDQAWVGGTARTFSVSATDAEKVRAAWPRASLPPMAAARR